MVTATPETVANLSWYVSAVGEAAYALNQAVGTPAATILFGLSLAALYRLVPARFRGGATSPEAAQGPGTGEPAPGLWPFVITATCTAVGLLLRLYARDAIPYWWDELLAVWIASADPATIIRTLATPEAPASDFTPPFFYLLLHSVSNAFGDGEAALRFFTALCGTLTIPATYVVGARLVSPLAGCGAACLLALSPAAIFYSQQVRCYSLLGLLTVLTVIFLDRAATRPEKGRLVTAALFATLTLYTHFVGTWFMAGLAGAFLAAALAQHPRFPNARLRNALARPRDIVLLAAVFLATACCPLFAAPQPASSALFLFLWTGLGCCAALVCLGLPWSGERAASGSGPFFPLALSLAVAAALFAPWLLYTHIWTIVSGPGTSVSGSYGLKELSQFLELYTGMPLRAGLFCMLVGLLSLLVRRPRTGLILTGWGLAPLALAMYVQNPTMNLPRYLTPSLPVFLILAAAGVLESLSVLPLLWRRLVGFRPLPRPGWGVAGLFVLFLFSVFGYNAFSSTPFPTRRTDYEDFPTVAAVLAKEPGLCLGTESSNLLRALSWYKQRQTAAPATCSSENGAILVYNIDQFGNPWHPKSQPVAGMPANATLLARANGIAACRIPATPPVDIAPRPLGTNQWDWPLSGDTLLYALYHGDNVGFSYFPSGLRPLVKGKPAKAFYRLSVPDAPVSGRMAMTVQIRLAGAASTVESRLRVGEKDHLALLLRDEGNGTVSGTLQHNDNTEAVPCRRKADKGYTCEASLPSIIVAGQPMSLEMTLFDDGSGVIYSSEAVLEAWSLAVQ
jgi:hypothetical protein